LVLVILLQIRFDPFLICFSKIARADDRIFQYNTNCFDYLNRSLIV
jgi:hypothetical protein